MSRIKIFKLIVQPTETCLELLRYLDKNIGDVNSLGAGVQIEKISNDEIDEDLIETFRKKGITRLPALLAPDGHVFIGLKQVIELFEKNLNSSRTGARAGPITDPYGGPANDAELGSNPDLTTFYMRELYSGCDKRGRLIPRKDKDEGNDDEEGGDIEKRLSDYRRNVPRHRRTDTGRERDIDPAPRQRGRRHEELTEDDDNIADDEDEYDEPAPPRRGNNGRSTRLSSTDDSRGDDMDQRMLDAWMANNPNEG